MGQVLPRSPQGRVVSVPIVREELVKKAEG